MTDNHTHPVPPASLTGDLFVDPSQVSACDLGSDLSGDLVALKLGDENARVTVLGTLDQVIDVVAAAQRAVGRIEMARAGTVRR